MVSCQKPVFFTNSAALDKGQKFSSPLYSLVIVVIRNNKRNNKHTDRKTITVFSQKLFIFEFFKPWESQTAKGFSLLYWKLGYGNYSRVETIKGRKLFAEIRYLLNFRRLHESSKQFDHKEPKYLKVALGQKILEDIFFFKKIFQITILSRKFEFPAQNRKQLIQIFCSE